MTILLFKTKKEAEDEVKDIKKIVWDTKVKPIRIQYDERDHDMFGLRGKNFKAVEGRKYYVVAETKKSLNDLYSKVL